MIMTMERQTRIYKGILFVMTVGDAILYLLFRDESELHTRFHNNFRLITVCSGLTSIGHAIVPRREFTACRIGICMILILTLFASNEARARLDSGRFRSLFATLSLMEVAFTILLPWLIISKDIFHRSRTIKNGHLLAGHLFIFQAQIAGECIVELADEKRSWLIFPFTCIANMYRGITIATWIQRVFAQQKIEYSDMVLPFIAGVLWIYSSFIFIPRVWYPLIKKVESCTST